MERDAFDETSKGDESGQVDEEALAQMKRQARRFFLLMLALGLALAVLGFFVGQHWRQQRDAAATELVSWSAVSACASCQHWEEVDNLPL